MKNEKINETALYMVVLFIGNLIVGTGVVLMSCFLWQEFSILLGAAFGSIFTIIIAIADYFELVECIEDLKVVFKGTELE